MSASEIKLEIKPLSKSVRIPKEKIAELKGVVSAKSISRMKQEGVLCPMKNETVSFIICFSCDKFIRRVKGYVYCSD